MSVLTVLGVSVRLFLYFIQFGFLSVFHLSATVLSCFFFHTAGHVQPAIFFRSEDSTSRDLPPKAVNQPNTIVHVPEFKPRVGDTPCYFVG